ncbi:hypothetical protein E2C01_074363 [Portunus trituberculatus]|uniref:Uncharacterized protein n=1 Tax=Portunus trituberculatus TaxID=210409 RepID=A0A5B7IE40_PORTR|nr:hypothetical protein [Portunus trituberculatus]
MKETGYFRPRKMAGVGAGRKFGGRAKRGWTGLNESKQGREGQDRIGTKSKRESVLQHEPHLYLASCASGRSPPIGHHTCTTHLRRALGAAVDVSFISDGGGGGGGGGGVMVGKSALPQANGSRDSADEVRVASLPGEGQGQGTSQMEGSCTSANPTKSPTMPRPIQGVEFPRPASNLLLYSCGHTHPADTVRVL